MKRTMKSCRHCRSVYPAGRAVKQHRAYCRKFWSKAAMKLIDAKAALSDWLLRPTTTNRGIDDVR